MMNKRAFVACLALLWFPISGIAATVASLPRATSGSPVLVVARPFGPSAKAIVAAAGGYRVGLGTLPIGIVAHSASSSFPSQLMSSGALLALDAALLPSFLCGANA